MTFRSGEKGTLSRRQLIKGAAAAGAATFAGGITVSGQQGGGPPSGVPPAPPLPGTPAGQARQASKLVLANGTIVDGRGALGTSMTIENGRISSVGHPAALGPDARVIDLGGRTV